MKIVVNAFDTNGIDRVKLYVDGVHIGGDLTAPYTFTWDSYSYAGRDVRIKALAVDKQGDKRSDQITISIPSSRSTNNASASASASASPSVLVVPPKTSTAGVMDIVVKASDSDGIDRVKLYVDGLHIGGDLTAPYTFTWDSYSYAGRDVRIKALAIDNKGDKRSDEIVIAVPHSQSSNNRPLSNTKPSSVSSPSSLPTNGNAKMLFVSDFESGRIQGRFENRDGWSVFTGGLKDGIVVQNAVTRAGKYAAMHYLEKADWNGVNTTQGRNSKPRSQLVKSNQAVPFRFDTEYWLGVSTFIPNNWQVDSNVNNGDVLWEFHASGEVGPNVPPLSLSVHGNKLEIENHYGDVQKRIETRSLWEGNLEKGRWVDWVVHVNFSLGKGYIQVWKNGAKVADFSGGPTTFYNGKNVKRDPLYFAMGLYKPKYAKMASSTRSRTIYFDELRVAQGGANGKNMVNPGASR